MSFIKAEDVDIAKSLKSGYFPFSRGDELEAALRDIVTDYYVKESAEVFLERRGLIVTGESRVGKSREINRLVSKFNSEKVLMPNGRPARIIQCDLSGKLTWKDLGIATARALGYPIERARTQGYIWDMVIQQAQRANVIGIHYDECQHVFSEKNHKANAIFLDNFKELLKDRRWPFLLILSGVPKLLEYIETEEQLRFLLEVVHFPTINMERDVEELVSLVFALAQKGEVEIGHLATADFFDRFAHGCAYRWGLVIEVLIEAIILCKRNGSTALELEHLVLAYAKRFNVPAAYSPFTLEFYREGLEPAKLIARLPT